MAGLLHRSSIHAVLAALLVIAVVGCGRDEPSTMPASDSDKKSAKSAAKKGDSHESSPGAKDPMKEGY